jgi:hypothetical protein
MAGIGFAQFHSIKEDRMPALRTRQEARERILRTMMAALDRIMPADEAKPLKGTTFGSWEDQTDEFKRAVIPTLLEERAALEPNARVEASGCCPLCGSESVYLEKQTTQPEVITPDGPVVIEKQHCRCRTCGGSFSPSKP